MKEIITAIAASDTKTILHVVHYKPEHEVIGVIQVLHGMTEHIGRYKEFAKFFTDKGYAVIGHDMIGYGKTKSYGMKEEDHIQLLETIVHCSAQIMISGYDTPLYNDYLHTWDTLRIPNQTTSGVVREEIVWMNYTHQLSLYDFGIL